MKVLRFLGVALIPFCICASALAQSWQPLANQPSVPNGIGVPLLLTDGTILCQDGGSNHWWKLTPDSSGSYVNGTWSQAASMDASYGPLYFASAVLADGRVVVVGGEYLFGVATWTRKAAVYDPIADAWTPLESPASWPKIGDAECAVLPDGRMMVADPFNEISAILNPATMTWTLVTAGKTDRFDEEGWTLLPDGSILTVDAINAPLAERFVPSLNTWMSAGSTPQSLADPSSQELGPAVLLPNGTVFATGATGHTAIYTPPIALTDTGTWVAGPDFPIIGGQQLDIADGPACLLPNGNVLCGASPGVFNNPTTFYEFDGASLNPVPATPNSPDNPSFVGNMLMLPTGQVMYTDFSNDVEIYTPAGAPQDAWRPTISACPATLTPTQAFSIQGTQFNGLSQCSAYGDDSTNATNYPIVRITNLGTGHVFYCRTFNHSTMGVATGLTPTNTTVLVPSNVEFGASTVEVVANGIASIPFAVTVNQSATSTIRPTTFHVDFGHFFSGSLTDLFVADASRISVFYDPTLSRTQPPVRVEFDGTAPAGNATELDFTLIGSENLAPVSSGTQKIEMFDFLTSSWVLVDTRVGSGSDATVTVANTTNPNDFIDPASRKMKARVSLLISHVQVTRNVGEKVNQAVWTVTTGGGQSPGGHGGGRRGG